jgi:phosphoribosyl-ATP pyrophosphohydrolase
MGQYAELRGRMSRLKLEDSILTRSVALGKSKHMTDSIRPIDHLELTILARKNESADKSYTAKLLAGGVEKIGGKLIEEAAEVVEAAGEEGEEGRQHTIYEAGDVMYHLMVLLAAREITLAEVEAELERRFGVSGLDEKNNRKT